MPVINHEMISDLNFWWLYDNGDGQNIDIPLNLISSLSLAESSYDDRTVSLQETYFMIPDAKKSDNLDLIVNDDYKSVAQKYNTTEDLVKKNSFSIRYDRLIDPPLVKYRINWCKFVKNSFIVIVTDSKNIYMASSQGHLNQDFIYDIDMIQVNPKFPRDNIYDDIIKFIYSNLNKIDKNIKVSEISQNK